MRWPSCLTRLSLVPPAYTPEELIAARRKERLHAKIERARLAVKAGQQLPDGIVALGGTLSPEEEKIIAGRAAKEVDDEDDDGAVEEEYGKHIPGLIYLGPKKDEGEQKQLSPEEIKRLEEEEANIEVEDMEYLHLSPYEVFFLAGMLGVLDVRDQEVSARVAGDLLQQLTHRVRLYRTTLSPFSTSTTPSSPRTSPLQFVLSPPSHPSPAPTTPSSSPTSSTITTAP